MLFNSYEFVFAFLPLTLLGFFLLGKYRKHRAAIAWLVFASLFFYGWWNPPFLLLLVLSIVLNFLLGAWLQRTPGSSAGLRAVALTVGVALNLGSIAYFKYANFIADNLNLLAGTDYNLGKIILPLAISFFTFQQITYLIDSYRGLAHESSFLNYCLFVSFFPQLIAGPIVHHSEMLSQFSNSKVFRFKPGNLTIGLTIFALGLFKKAVLADGIAVYANPVFLAADSGQAVSMLDAWTGALAYTFQLYFDFSGYSDMALGAARMFGIRLPVNFNSPYKATSIIDFWRRWHITLSRFLRDYVYIELGGNQKGSSRRYVNLMLTMLIGGLWHGAGWTFVVWGALHGFYLIVNYAWRWFRQVLHGGVLPPATPVGCCLSWATTMVAVIAGWVFFRATTFEGAMNIITGMMGLNGVTLPAAIGLKLGALADTLTDIGIVFTPGGGEQFIVGWGWIIALAVIAFLFPNTLDITRRYRPALYYQLLRQPRRSSLGLFGYLDRLAEVRWRPTTVWALVVATLATSGVLALPEVSEFLYFQF